MYPVLKKSIALPTQNLVKVLKIAGKIFAKWCLFKNNSDKIPLKEVKKNLE
ncbi:hypothetical protein [Enterococcus faecium]|uniref:hypothetical protein n=1 Tax=Enterococcus faecium TaxID=1352 RepID=UPI0015C4EC0D|nr:hypothetical protein [Enterococcus faecium]